MSVYACPSTAEGRVEPLNFSVGVGAVTVRVTGALVMPPAVAAILVVPAATPVASPVVLIVAVAALLLDHVKLALFTALPLESFAVAVNCAVPATVTEGDVGETVTLATETGAGLFPPVPLTAPPLHPESETAMRIMPCETSVRAIVEFVWLLGSIWP